MRATGPDDFVWFFCIAVLGLSVAACGPNTSNNGNNGGASADTPQEFQDAFGELFAESLCKASYQCPEEQDAFTLQLTSRYGSQEACTQNILDDTGFFDSSFAGDVEAGLTNFDSEKAQECLRAFESMAQNDACFTAFSNIESPDACEETLSGTQPNGQACDSDDHCQSGYCDTEVETMQCWGGECAEAPEDQTQVQGEGDPCSEINQECDRSQNLTCDYDSSGSDLICVKLDSRASGEPCFGMDVCQSGLRCQQQQCTESSLAAEDESCETNNPLCEPGPRLQGRRSHRPRGLHVHLPAPRRRRRRVLLPLGLQAGSLL